MVQTQLAHPVLVIQTQLAQITGPPPKHPTLGLIPSPKLIPLIPVVRIEPASLLAVPHLKFGPHLTVPIKLDPVNSSANFPEKIRPTIMRIMRGRVMRRRGVVPGGTKRRTRLSVTNGHGDRTTAVMTRASEGRASDQGNQQCDDDNKVLAHDSLPSFRLRRSRFFVQRFNPNSTLHYSIMLTYLSSSIDENAKKWPILETYPLPSFA